MSSSPSAHSSSPDPSSSEMAGLTESQVRQYKIEHHREQTRARMARYRAKLKELSVEEQQAATMRAREARARYRERHRTELVNAARCKRHAAYAEKYGMAAYEAKMERKQQRLLENQERPRRRARVKPSTKTPGKTSRDTVDAPVRGPIIHPYQYVYPCRD